MSSWESGDGPGETEGEGLHPSLHPLLPRKPLEEERHQHFYLFPQVPMTTIMETGKLGRVCPPLVSEDRTYCQGMAQGPGPKARPEMPSDLGSAP